MLEEINQIIQEIKHDESIRCFLITGAGSKVFCAGADLKERRLMTEAEAKALFFRFSKRLSRLNLFLYLSLQ